MKTKENLTREYIVSAFEKLLETENYDKISVCDIADKAGVSRMSFYRNFKSKEALIYSFFDEVSKELKNNINNLEVKNQFTITKQYFEIFKKYNLAIHSMMESEITKTLGAAIMQKLKDNIPHDYMNKTSKYIPIYYFGAMTSVLMNWLKDGMVESTDDMARLLCSLNDFAPEFKPKPLNNQN